jgi:biopolymer transport protein ExbD
MVAATRGGGRMKRIEFSESGSGVEINLSPLIDCVFLLLIFFIVTTVFVEETGVEVQKPRAASARELDKHSVMFALMANGDIVYGGRVIQLNSVRGIVSQQMLEKKAPVIIMADTDSKSGNLVDLVDECRLAGAEQVSVAADTEPAGRLP